MTDSHDLAAQVKAWRGKVPAREAAEILGIPRRTFENIEQGRGFPYPQLLLIALKATDPNEGKDA
jgi:DNA-binding XRE family transcriptional regulator